MGLARPVLDGASYEFIRSIASDAFKNTQHTAKK
jgi:hypothetical protein